MTSSLDANLFSPSHFFIFGNRKKSQGAKSGEYGRCESNLQLNSTNLAAATRDQCLGALTWWTALSSSPSGAIFPSMHRQICPIIDHNIALWSFFPFSNSRWRLCLLNPRKWWPWPFGPMELSLPSLVLVCRVTSTVLTLLSFLACNVGFMFHQQLRNGEETPLDCA
jgi:hypothetical protein